MTTTPVLLPGKSHGQRRLVGCSPCGREKLDTTSLSLFPFMHWRRKRQPTPVFLPGESQGWEPGGLLSMGRTESDTTKATQQQQQHKIKICVGFPDSSVGKESTCKAGDTGSVPGSGRSSGGRHGSTLQYSCLENPVDPGAWRATRGHKESDMTEETEHVCLIKICDQANLRKNEQKSKIFQNQDNYYPRA